MITLGDNSPLDYNLKPIKVGGEVSPLEISSSYPDDSNNAKVKVVGDLEVTGSILKQPTLHFINGGATTTSANLFYLPLVGYNFELTSSTGRNENLSFVTPYDGILKKVVLRSENRCDTVVVGFHKSSEGTEIPNTSPTEEQSQEMPVDDIAHTFNFTQSTFVAGDIINISVNADIAVGDTVWTAVFEYRGV